jgi:ribonuclease R
VVAEIVRYPSESSRELAARVLRVLGHPDDPRTEIEKILACAEIPRDFFEEALAQAEATPKEVRPVDLADRIDLRDRPFATIDPEDARDFDDAVCIEDGPHGGPRVWVAVADVSHYVRTGDALDRESTIRGVSVYLPDRVIPMLPFALSSGICSLNPHVDRLAMVVRLDMRDDGTIVDTGYAAAVIRSHARLDYPGVAAALTGDFRGRREEYRPWAPTLERLNALARVLRERRRARGALDLDLPEAKVLLDADDPRLVRDVVRSKANEDVKQAYELVEEYMIAANEAVGAFFRSRDAITVWRIHAPPLRARVEDLARVLAAYGIEIDPDDAMTPLGMKAVLDKVNNQYRGDGGAHPAARSLQFLVLRALKQAVWSTTPVGHFGLASQDYLHFTSPIRRYPDVLVHRLLKHHLYLTGQASGGGHAEPPPARDKLEELAAASSAHERRAMEAERESVSMYRAYLMRSQVGEQFKATVSGVTSFGVFIEIDTPFIEGLIKLEALGDDFFEFDEIGMRLRGRRTGLVIGLGDRVTVELVNVSVPRRRIDFRLISLEGGVRAPPARPVRPSTGRPPMRRDRSSGGGGGGGDKRKAKPVRKRR